jgi:tRNASer (uridine44-2'-O)-methyltransferase
MPLESPNLQDFAGDNSESAHVTQDRRFKPYDLGQHVPQDGSGLSPTVWTLAQSAPALFAPDLFDAVTHNMLCNPNITSSVLARAEIFYDSAKDDTFNPAAGSPEELGSFIKYMRVEDRPRIIPGKYEGYRLERTEPWTNL